MTWTEIFLLIIVVALIPPKYDPAVRLKEWMISKGWRRW